MGYKEITDYLSGQCANCSFCFEKPSCGGVTKITKLSFTEVSNLEAISFIFGVSLTQLESALIHYARNTQNIKDSWTDDDIINNLAMCPKCAPVLEQMYKIHKKFDELADKNSFICTGVRLSRDSVEVKVEPEITDNYSQSDTELDPFDDVDTKEYSKQESSIWDDEKNIKEEKVSDDYLIHDFDTSQVADTIVEKSHQSSFPKRRGSRKQDMSVTRQLISDSDSWSTRTNDNEFQSNSWLPEEVRPHLAIIDTPNIKKPRTILPKPSTLQNSPIDFAETQNTAFQNTYQKVFLLVTPCSLPQPVVHVESAPQGDQRVENEDSSFRYTTRSKTNPKFKKCYRKLDGGRCTDDNNSDAESVKSDCVSVLDDTVIDNDGTSSEGSNGEDEDDCSETDPLGELPVDTTTESASTSKQKTCKRLGERNSLPIAKGYVEVGKKVQGPPFICPKCRRSYNTLQSIRKHCKIRHRMKIPNLRTPNPNVRLCCVKCNVYFTSSVGLRNHNRFRHKTTTDVKHAERIVRRHQVQRRKFSNISKLRYRIHSCRHCDETFASKYAMMLHEVSHNEKGVTEFVEKIKGPPFQCPKCHKSYKDKSTFRIHALNQHNILLPFQKRFSQMKKVTCTECNISFRNMTGWKSHQRGNHGMTFFCMKCNECFPENVLLLSHIKSTHPLTISVMDMKATTEEKIQESEISPATASTTDELVDGKQKKKRTPWKPARSIISCTECGELFFTQYSYTVHSMIKHAGTSLETLLVDRQPPFNCPRCPTVYGHLGSLRYHCIKTHKLNVSTSEKYTKVFFSRNFRADNDDTIKNEVVQADNSGNVTKQNDSSDIKPKQDDLKSNTTVQNEDNDDSQMLEDGSKVFNCVDCELKFPTLGCLKAHMMTHTHGYETIQEAENSSNRGTRVCPRCGTVFNTFNRLRNHCLKKHQLVISTTETTLEGLREDNSKQGSRKPTKKDGEIKRDRTSGPAVCEFCGKVFSKRGELRPHLISHETNKQYICEKCGKAFKRITDLRKHVIIHTQVETGTRPICSICGKSFLHNLALGKHKYRYHSKKRPCPICQKTFASVEYMSVHLRNQHGKFSSNYSKYSGKPSTVTTDQVAP